MRPLNPSDPWAGGFYRLSRRTCLQHALFQLRTLDPVPSSILGFVKIFVHMVQHVIHREVFFECLRGKPRNTKTGRNADLFIADGVGRMRDHRPKPFGKVPCAFKVSFNTTRNSSPPYRADQSIWSRTESVIQPTKPCNMRSPDRWPYVSLTDLK